MTGFCIAGVVWPHAASLFIVIRIRKTRVRSELFGAGRNRRSETGWISFSRWSWRSGRIRKASEERLFIPGICPDFPKRLGKAPNLDPDVAYIGLAEARDSLARGQMRRGHDPGKSGAALIQHITEIGKDSGSGAHVLAKPDL
ncbi:hypothetical protein ACVI1L_004727 [Bradyrhizobium sp. USDA 4516]